MIDVVIKLIWNHTIFCKLFEKKEAYTEARQAHPEFFVTMCDSLLCSFFVAADLLFCDKEKATSLRNLIKDIQVSKPELANTLNEQIRAGKGSLIEKIGIMRNQVCAHRWEAKTPQEVFGEASVRLNMMKEITDLAQSIICELVEEFGGNWKEDLEKQQLSNNTLQCITDDAGLVMCAFVETV
jgi:lambda repressor-like predicted transcriptional regulator